MGGQGTAGMGWRSAGPEVPNTGWVPKGGFMARGVQVVAVCDVDRQRREKAAEMTREHMSQVTGGLNIPGLF